MTDKTQHFNAPGYLGQSLHNINYDCMLSNIVSMPCQNNKMFIFFIFSENDKWGSTFQCTGTLRSKFA